MGKRTTMKENEVKTEKGKGREGEECSNRKEWGRKRSKDKGEKQNKEKMIIY